MDFSIEEDFNDLEKVALVISNSLQAAFTNIGLRVFDFTLESKPKVSTSPWWGGYRAEFKLIAESRAKALDFNTEDMRRQSIPIESGSQRRKYAIEISKFEYIAGKERQHIDNVDVFVYSTLLLAVEKLRALLQQHPNYPHIPVTTKRSRAICDYFTLRLDMYLSTVEAVFNAKKVDLDLLSRLMEIKEFHRASWPDVEVSLSRELEPFDFYFDYVNTTAVNLYTKWIENSP